MKKSKTTFLALILSVMMILCLASCGGTQSGSSSAPNSVSTSAPSSTVSPASSSEATSSVTETSTTPAASGFNQSDMSITLNGVAVKFMEDSAPVITALGKNYTLEEQTSCNYNGNDKYFTYTDIEVCTFPVGGKDVVGEISLLTNKYATNRGIKVGDTKEKVTGAYGDNFTIDPDATQLTYWLGEKDDSKTPKLYFDLEDGKVTGIGIYCAGQKI